MNSSLEQTALSHRNVRLLQATPASIIEVYMSVTDSNTVDRPRPAWPCHIYVQWYSGVASSVGHKFHPWLQCAAASDFVNNVYIYSAVSLLKNSCICQLLILVQLLLWLRPMRVTIMGRSFAALASIVLLTLNNRNSGLRGSQWQNPPPKMLRWADSRWRCQENGDCRKRRCSFMGWCYPIVSLFCLYLRCQLLK